MRIINLHRGLLLLAGLLLSLHSLVPHVHGAACNNAEEETATHIPPASNDLLSLLQTLFTDTDLGEDHLEHFAADHDISFEFEITASPPPVAHPIIVLVPRTGAPLVRRQRIFRSRQFPPSGIYPDADAPRGPPTHV